MQAGAKWGARIARTRLARPMALMMGAATAFIVYAIPAGIVEDGIFAMDVAPLAATALPFGGMQRLVLAALLALGSGMAVWMLFDRLERPRIARPADGEPDIDLFAPRPSSRRADKQAATAARRPLFAASDLGTPMDDVDRGPTPFGRPPLFVDDAPGDESGAGAADRIVPPEPDIGGEVAETVPADEQVRPTMFRGEDEPSITQRLMRLERGIERRSDVGASPRPRFDEALHDALDALRGAAAKR